MEYSGACATGLRFRGMTLDTPPKLEKRGFEGYRVNLLVRCTTNTYFMMDNELHNCSSKQYDKNSSKVKCRDGSSTASVTRRY